MAANSYMACIVRRGKPGSYHYDVIAGRENFPVTYVSFSNEEIYEAQTGYSLLDHEQNGDDDLKCNVKGFSRANSAASEMLCLNVVDSLKNEGSLLSEMDVAAIILGTLFLGKYGYDQYESYSRVNDSLEHDAFYRNNLNDRYEDTLILEQNHRTAISQKKYTLATYYKQAIIASRQCDYWNRHFLQKTDWKWPEMRLAAYELPSVHDHLNLLLLKEKVKECSIMAAEVAAKQTGTNEDSKIQQRQAVKWAQVAAAYEKVAYRIARKFFDNSEVPEYFTPYGDNRKLGLGFLQRYCRFFMRNCISSDESLRIRDNARLEKLLKYANSALRNLTEQPFDLNSKKISELGYSTDEMSRLIFKRNEEKAPYSLSRRNGSVLLSGDDSGEYF